MSDKIKKVAWGIMGMIPYNQEFHERLGMPAYVRIENYQFIQKKAENLEAENARLKADNERLRKAGDAIVKDNLNWLTDKKHIAEWHAAKEGKQP